MIPANHLAPRFPAGDPAGKKEHTCSRPLKHCDSVSAKKIKSHYLNPPGICLQVLGASGDSSSFQRQLSLKHALFSTVQKMLQPEISQLKQINYDFKYSRCRPGNLVRWVLNQWWKKGCNELKSLHLPIQSWSFVPQGLDELEVSRQTIDSQFRK